MIKKKNLLKSLIIFKDFNVTFKKLSEVIPPKPPQKTGLRPVDRHFALVLLRHSNLHLPPPNFSRSTTVSKHKFFCYEQTLASNIYYFVT